MEKTKINVDTAAISRPVAEQLARSTLEAVKRYMAQPGGAERLDEFAEKRRQRLAAEAAKLNDNERSEGKS